MTDPGDMRDQRGLGAGAGGKGHRSSRVEQRMLTAAPCLCGARAQNEGATAACQHWAPEMAAHAKEGAADAGTRGLRRGAHRPGEDRSARGTQAGPGTA
ncbi:hypothetical protein ZWY2020_037964 [Hordeum vulgare]|nr:hypothetical protein ZWY2020_037964 [Hordeum vulgare]